MFETSFDTLLRRFHMKFMPEILNTEDTAAREAIIDQHILDRPDDAPLEYQAVEFFHTQGSELSGKEIMTRLFGVGENRFFHDEHNLMGTPLRQVDSIQSMVQRLADVQIELRGADIKDQEAFYRQELTHFNLWAMGFVDGCYQHFIVNTASMDYYWACEEIMLGKSSELIPSELRYLPLEDGSVEMVTDIKDPVHEKIDAELSRYCFRRAQHWSRHIAAEQKTTGVVAVNRRQGDDLTLVTYVFLDPEDARHVRPTRFIHDISQLREIDLETHIQQAIAPYRERMLAEVVEEYQRLYDERRDGTVEAIDSQRDPMRVIMSPEMLESLEAIDDEDAATPQDDTYDEKDKDT